jgi:branched-chain amino acid transport system substrate-binding protein
MSKFVVLNIDEGSFEQGFPVSLGIGEDGPTYYKEKLKLPPAPDIPRLYQEWQESYRDLGKNPRQIDVPSAQVTRVSIIENEKEARDKFEEYLYQWFSQLPWRELRVRIEERTQPDEIIRVIIDTNNIYLKKLPWHLWELFHSRQSAEFALSAEYAPPTEALKRPVKILAIFGGSEGLDLTSDRELIENLRSRGAKITWLEQPHLSQLSESLWNQHWDILFFAGHSSSGKECNSGEIQINDKESISLTLFRNSLRSAVKKGLKLAIFNSCDGLGLADELSGVKVPQMIVMREPVPDEVARQFLKYFLEDFSKGHPLYLAVRNARQRLEWMEKDFPCASWLPVICQNPAARPLVWPNASIQFKKIAAVAGILGAVSLGLILGYKVFPNLISQIAQNPQSQEKAEAKPKASLQNLGKNFSWGEKILISPESTSNKNFGVKAFANREYLQAAQYFKKSLNDKPNDPETLIYLNNAVAEQFTKINLLPVPNSLKSNLNACSLKNNPNYNRKILKIAVPVPIDADSHIARDILRGVAQAQNQINCTGGINGKLLQVIIVDDKDDKSVVNNVAQKLVETLDILAVAGHYSSSSTLQASKIYDGNIVAVSPTSNAFRKSKTNPDGLNFSEWVLRTSPDSAKDLVEYMVDTKGFKKAAIAHVPNRVWSQSTYKEFKKYLESKGGEIVYDCKLNGNFIADNCLKNAIKQQAEVMLLLPEINNNRFDQALQLFYANYKSPNKLFLLGGTTMYNSKVPRQGELAENMVTSMYWHRNDDNPSKFERDALTLWNAKVNGRTAMGYDATTAIIEGLKRIDGNPTRQALKQVLSSPNFSAEGAAGKVEFNQDGDRRITQKNDAEIGVLVQVKCDIPQSCKFVKVPQQ